MAEPDVIALREKLRGELDNPGFNPLARRLYDWMMTVLGRILHLGKLPALVVSCVIVIALSLILGFVIELMTGTLQSLHPIELAGHVLAAIGTALIPLDAQWYASHISSNLRQYILPNIVSRDNLEDLQRWLYRANRLAFPSVFSLIFAIAATIFTVLSLSNIVGDLIGAGAVVVNLVAYFQLGTAISFRIHEISLYRRLSRYQFELYEPNPSQSTVMLALYRMVTTPLFLIGSTTAMLTIFVVITSGIQSFYISFLIVVWVSMIAAYIFSQRLLSQIIMRNKSASKVEVASRVKGLSNRLEHESARNEMEWLMNYHDRIANSPNSMVNLRSATNFVLALLLPAIIVVIQVVITDIIKRIL